jgi:predicted RNA-binding protein with TRAM domain
VAAFATSYYEPVSITIGAELRLRIDKPAAGGWMIARDNGQIVLVAGAIPGETVLARVERSGKGVAFARVVSVTDPSVDRRDPFTDPLCGGCLYAHVAYPRQLEIKGQVVADALTRIGRIPTTQRQRWRLASRGLPMRVGRTFAMAGPDSSAKDARDLRARRRGSCCRRRDVLDRPLPRCDAWRGPSAKSRSREHRGRPACAASRTAGSSISAGRGATASAGITGPTWSAPRRRPSRRRHVGD